MVTINVKLMFSVRVFIEECAWLRN